jgi:hypothetical protein
MGIIQRMTDAAMMVFFIVATFTMGSIGYVIVNGQGMEVVEEHTYDAIGRVECATASMEPSLECNDVLYKMRVKKDDPVYPGEVYTYNRGNNSIVHRLVKCLDNCTRLVFKGDNNDVADDIVDRSKARLYKVEKVRYG